MTQITASKLVLDFDLYPRADVDAANVRRLRDAIRAGASLPPVLVEKDSYRVVDGFHRVKAWRKAKGEDAPIPASLREYNSEADLLLDALHHNADHGKQLSPYDHARALTLAEEHGLSVDDVASALEIPTAKLEELKTRKIGSSNGRPIPVKQTARHLAGRELSKRQEEAHSRAGGMNQLHYVNQVINLIEGDLLDRENEALMDRLEVLGSLINEL